MINKLCRLNACVTLPDGNLHIPSYHHLRMRYQSGARAQLSAAAYACAHAVSATELGMQSFFISGSGVCAAQARGVDDGGRHDLYGDPGAANVHQGSALGEHACGAGDQGHHPAPVEPPALPAWPAHGRSHARRGHHLMEYGASVQTVCKQAASRSAGLRTPHLCAVCGANRSPPAARSLASAR